MTDDVTEEVIARLRAVGVTWTDGQAVRQVLDSEYRVMNVGRIQKLVERIVVVLNESTEDMSTAEVFSALNEVLARAALANTHPAVSVIHFRIPRKPEGGP